MSRVSEEKANRELSESREPPALLKERPPLDLRDETSEVKGDPFDPSTWAILP